MTVVNSEREVGYSVSIRAVRHGELVMLPAGRHSVRGVSAVAPAFSASQARQRSMGGGGRFWHGAIRLRLVFRFAVMMVFV
jgi:hypothetical protein